MHLKFLEKMVCSQINYYWEYIINHQEERIENKWKDINFILTFNKTLKSFSI